MCSKSTYNTTHTLFFLTRENSLSFSTSFLCCLACLVTASGLGCRAYQRYALGVETRIRQKRTQQGRYTHKKLLRSLFTRSIARTIFTRLFVYDTQVHAAIMCATGYSQWKLQWNWICKLCKTSPPQWDFSFLLTPVVSCFCIVSLRFSSFVCCRFFFCCLRDTLLLFFHGRNTNDDDGRYLFCTIRSLQGTISMLDRARYDLHWVMRVFELTEDE